MAEFGVVLLACFLVNLVTLIGVALLGSKATMTSTRGRMHRPLAHWVGGALQGFAAGALLGSVSFLMLLESAHLTQAEWSGSGESGVAWRWGTSLLVGFLMPLVGQSLAEAAGVDLVLCLKGGIEFKKEKELNPDRNSHVVPDQNDFEPGQERRARLGGMEDHEEEKAGGRSDSFSVGETSEAVGQVDVGALNSDMSTENTTTRTLTSARSGSAVFAVCIGDFFHNFTDGVFIGAAFKLCSKNAGWAVAAASAAHEVAQELADYVVLTSEQVGLSPVRALAVNFITGISIILGGVLVTAIDIHDGSLGLLLAIGAGSYIYLGAVVSMPAALAAAATHVQQQEKNGNPRANEETAVCRGARGDQRETNDTLEDVDKDGATRVSCCGSEGTMHEGNGCRPPKKSVLLCRREEDMSPSERFKRHRAVVLLAFLVGAVAIGLVLLNHKHCEDEGHAHGEKEELEGGQYE